MDHPLVYLDNAATTYPKAEEVYEALDFANRHLAFNAGRGSYSSSKETFNLISNTRNAIGDIVSTSGSNVVFTSSATESLNLIINGLSLQSGDVVYISPFEHNAIIRPLHALKKEKNIKVEVLPFNKKTWLPELDVIRNMFAIKKPKAVFLSHVSNVTGYELPYSSIFALSREFGSINVLDCAQSFGIVPIDKKTIDFIVFAGHKSLYASFGIAGFVTLTNTTLQVTKSGGTGSDSLNPEMPIEIPGKYEAGSPNSVAIAGLLAATKWLKTVDVFKHEKQLTNYLIERLQQNPKIVTYLPENKNVIGTTSFNINGYSSSDVGTILSEEYNISVRTGYHCAPLIHDFIESKAFVGTVRVSLGAFNSVADIDYLIGALETF